MAGVFISYARDDASKAKAIARALEEASLDVWFDERIQSGAEFSGEIEAALDKAAAVVVLWSRSSIASPWVRDEASEGRDTGRLVPIVLDDCRPPMGFRQFQSADVSRWSGAGRPENIDAIVAAVCAKTGVPAKPVTSNAREPKTRRPVIWAAAAAALAIAGGVFVNIGRGPASSPAPSVALLPFAADATDPAARKLAMAAHDSVAHTLTETLVAVRLIDSMPERGRAPADFVISGQLSSTATKETITVRMEDAARKVIVFSKQFEASHDTAAGLPDQIGAQVAVALRPLSQRAPAQFLRELHDPSDPSVTTQLLRIVISLNSNVDLLQSYETYRRLAANTPNSGIVQLGLALHTAFALNQIPRGERAQAVAAARIAADRAVALAPDFGDVQIPWCLLHSPLRLVECEDRLRAARSRDPDSSFVNAMLAGLLNDVGRNSEAAEVAGLAHANAQYVPSRISAMLQMQEATGETDAAEQLYRRANKWWPGNPMIESGRWYGVIQRGDFVAAQKFNDEIRKADPAPIEDSISSLFAAVTANSRSQVAKVCSAEAEILDLCMLSLAQAGDLDGAYRFAARLYPMRRGRTSADEERIWLENPDPLPLALLSSPSAIALRRDPRFLVIAARVGLLAYWRSGRLPDFCTNGHEPVCKAIARAM